MISVIIPTLNEESRIGFLLSQLEDRHQIAEVLVVDGGSEDNTIEIVGRYSKSKYLKSNRGRACQMNKGAEAARQPHLLFLHADSDITNLDLDQIPLLLKTCLAGCFKLSFDKESPLLNLYSKMSGINHSWFTYGDQGLFIKKEDFNLIGGFANIPIMEDIDFVKRVKKLGKFKKVNSRMITSSRRFEERGVLRQQFRNVSLVMMYELGFSPTFLSRFYKY